MKKVGEFWYPDSEERLHRNHSSLWQLENDIIPAMSSMRTVIQAGGAVGAWPITYAKHFDEVYTFEPNPALIECFERNLVEYPENKDKIVLNTHGLWNEECFGEMVEHQANNMGAWYFKPEEDGSIAVHTIDSYALDNVDLIQLDIEGGEYEALLGAVETIKKWKPMLCIELKMTQAFYGRTVEDVYCLLHKLGYETHSVFGRDQLWTSRLPQPA